MTTPFHSATPLPLRLTLESPKRRVETLRFAPQATLAPAFETITVTLDGRTVVRHWPAGAALEFTWDLAPGAHRLAVDAGGLWPAESVTLPESTSAITGIIPTIADPATGEPSPDTFWLAPGTELANLTSVFASAFVRNTHRTSFERFFAGAKKLTSVPEALFFPTIRVESFAGTFAHTGLTTVSGQQFNCTPLVTDFSECFLDTPLAAVPEELFGETPLAKNFTRTFANTRVTQVPEGLFAGTAKGGVFTEAFARDDIRSVPAELMACLEPADVDGMFTPPRTTAYDPLNLKTAAVLPPEFLRDTVNASGVPTKAFGD